MEKPDYSGCAKDVITYIKYLEGALHGSTKLINELNLLSDGYGDDLEKIRLGEAGDGNTNLKYIKEDANDPSFNIKMILLSKIRDFKALQAVTKPDKAAPNAVEEETTTTTVKKKVNIQDFVIPQ